MPDLEGKSPENSTFIILASSSMTTAFAWRFRYGSGFWSTVLSYDLKVWVSQKDTNVLVVEVLVGKSGRCPCRLTTF
ncbi:MAG: hypothetical protein U0744_19620 [Gemmataceae bacterium]